MPEATRKVNKKKYPHHLTGEEGMDMIREADAKAKVKEVKNLERQACIQTALKDKAKSDRARTRAAREGDPMRARQSTVDAVEKVFDKETANKVAAGAPIPGTKAVAPKKPPKRYGEPKLAATPKKRKCVERRTTQRRPAALPRAPKSKKK